MFRSAKRIGMITFSALVFGAIWAPQSAPAQAVAATDEAGLMSMIPQEAILFIERRGHEAVHQAFAASNLGEMAADEAIKQFVEDTRVQVGRMIVKDMFKLTDAAEITRHQELLHGLLKPFWHNPCAMFLVVDANANRAPEVGFICVTGKYADECKASLEALVKIGVAPEGQAGTRQAFTYKSGSITWQGVAKGYTEFTISKSATQPIAEQLQDKSVFLVHWMGHLLCVATDLRAADALSRTLTMTDKAAGKAANESLQAVMKKTALKDWAFRWFVDVDALLKMAQKGNSRDQMWKIMKAIGADRIRGIGGTGGYADKVFTRMTYIDAPNAPSGILKPGGSYKQALAMVPESTFCLAAQIDMKVPVRIVREVAEAGAGEAADDAAEPGKDPAPRKPSLGTSRPAAKLDEKTEKVLKQIEQVADTCGGNAAFFVTDVQAMMGMMMGSGPPIGFVLDLKDPVKAEKAIDDLLVEIQGKKEGETDEDQPKGPAEYRKTKIRRVQKIVRIAILKDRMVVALDDTALKAAIDAALDKTGGFAHGGKADALAKLAGDGSAIFSMDLAALAKLGWPILMKLAESPEGREHVPLASLPSTEKMVRMLGPEIAVLEADAGGILMKSRGKIPFATKAVVAMPLMAIPIFMFFH